MTIVGGVQKKRGNHTKRRSVGPMLQCMHISNIIVREIVDRAKDSVFYDFMIGYYLKHYAKLASEMKSEG